ncbi:MAG: DUF2997 domain-containing protein [bacterium]|nr:DUF2997 domain-containing protein [bacterium]
MRRIKFEVDPRGRVKADFSGFAGEDCREEEEKLRRLLAGLGLAMATASVRPKEPGVIAAELGLAGEEAGEEVGHR